jgi:acetyl-CoA C-acetyltransferase
MISVISQYTTKFGELWDKSLYDLIEEAIDGSLKSASLEKENIDAVFYGNMLGGILENNVHGGAKIAEIFENNIPMFRLEAACASGGVAFHNAYNYVMAGAAETVLVIGAEKMTDFPAEVVVSALSAAAAGEEQEAGLTFPGLYGLLARVYMQNYGYTEKDLAYVSVKNHYHGTLNSKAQFRKDITIADVMNSPYVASPLKVLDSSPISDGASAVIITKNKKLISAAKASIQILATEVATDSISLAKRKKLDELAATVYAAQKAYKTASLKPKDISIAEVHDCFTIAELFAMENLGFFKKGTAGIALLVSYFIG